MNSHALKLLLVASLLLNAIAFAYMGKALAACHTSLPRHRVNIHELVATLPADKQQKLAPVLVQFEKDDNQLNDRVMQEREKLVALVQASPFNEKAFFAQIKVLSDLRLQNTKNMSAIMDKIIASGSDEERQQMGAKLSDMIIEKQK